MINTNSLRLQYLTTHDPEHTYSEVRRTIYNHKCKADAQDWNKFFWTGWTHDTVREVVRKFKRKGISVSIFDTKQKKGEKLV